MLSSVFCKMEGEPHPQPSKINLLDLPNEILVQILRLLPFDEVHGKCAKVNRRFRELSQLTYPTIPCITLTLPEDVSEQSGLLQRLSTFVTEENPLVISFLLRGVIREWPNLLKLLQILQRLPSLRILILTINLEFPMDPDTDEAEQEYQRNKTEIELEAQKTWSKLECLKVLTVGPWQCHHKTVESNFPPGIVSLSYGLYQYEDEVPIQELRPLEAFIRGQFRSYDNDKRCADILNQQNFTGGLDLIRIKRIHFSNLRTLTITIIVRGQVTKELWSISKDCPNLESLSVLLMAPFLDGGPGIQTTFWRSQRLSCHPEGLTPLIMFPELKTFTVLIFVKKDEDSVPFVVELLRNFNCFRNGKWFQAKKPKLLKLESDPPPDKSPAGFIMEQETRLEQLDSYNLIQDEAKPLGQENWFTKDLGWKKLDRNGLSYKLTRYRTKH